MTLAALRRLLPEPVAEPVAVLGEGDKEKSVIVFFASDARRPVFLAKLACGPARDRLEREAAVQAELAARLDSARDGFAVPGLVGRTEIGATLAVVERFAPGKSRAGERGVQDLERLLVVARAVDAALAAGTAAKTRPRQHGDLGVQNILFHGDAATVIDWELCADYPPFFDLFCLVTSLGFHSAPAAGDEYERMQRNLERCFFRREPWGDLIRKHLAPAETDPFAAFLDYLAAREEQRRRGFGALRVAEHYARLRAAFASRRDGFLGGA